MSKNTLHISKLENFKQYLVNSGVAYRPGKGDFQVLQVQLNNGGWACIYSRHDMPEHYTTDKRLDSLVRKFVSSSKDGATKRQHLSDEAKAVIDAARAAIDSSTEANDEDDSLKIPQHLAAALSVRLDEYDRSISKATGEQK